MTLIPWYLEFEVSVRKLQPLTKNELSRSRISNVIVGRWQTNKQMPAKTYTMHAATRMGNNLRHLLAFLFHIFDTKMIMQFRMKITSLAMHLHTASCIIYYWTNCFEVTITCNRCITEARCTRSISLFTIRRQLVCRRCDLHNPFSEVGYFWPSLMSIQQQIS